MMTWFIDLRKLIRTLDGLLELERKHDGLIENLKGRDLGSQTPTSVADARAAASVVASSVAAQHIADLARRIGVLEEQLRHLQEPGRRLTEG